MPTKEATRKEQVPSKEGQEEIIYLQKKQLKRPSHLKKSNDSKWSGIEELHSSCKPPSPEMHCEFNGVLGEGRRGLHISLLGETQEVKKIEKPIMSIFMVNSDVPGCFATANHQRC